MRNQILQKKDASSEAGDHDNNRRGGTSLPAVPVLQQQTKPAQPLTEEELLEKPDKPFQLAAAEVHRPNNTGLPDDLKAGVESISGFSMDDVRVHYNSDKPAQLQALAYAQGTDIHVGPGQEKHLPHEAWHVVQQKQGRVQPTMQMKGSVAVNDDKGLESEADVMGNRAFNFQSTPKSTLQLKSNKSNIVQLFDWNRSSFLTTIYDYLNNPTKEGAKDIIDPRRSRLNPLNLVEGVRNYMEETAGGNYHTSSRHGAHNTVRNSMNRLQHPSTMIDEYNGGYVPAANTQGRFNSEAWESFSWRKAKELFESDIGVAVQWVAGPILPAHRSTWRICLNHAGSDVGISQAGLANAINSVSGVLVAINYTIIAGGGVQAYNGQMFPATPVAPVAGVVRPGHPNGASNGSLQPIPYQFLGYFGI